MAEILSRKGVQHQSIINICSNDIWVKGIHLILPPSTRGFWIGVIYILTARERNLKIGTLRKTTIEHDASEFDSFYRRVTVYNVTLYYRDYSFFLKRYDKLIQTSSFYLHFQNNQGHNNIPCFSTPFNNRWFFKNQTT